MAEHRYAAKDCCTPCRCDTCKACRGNGCACRKYNHPVSHYCGITDTMTVSCGCPDDFDEREAYLRDYAQYFIEHGDVPDSWRGLKRVIASIERQGI